MATLIFAGPTEHSSDWTHAKAGVNIAPTLDPDARGLSWVKIITKEPVDVLINGDPRQTRKDPNGAYNGRGAGCFLVARSTITETAAGGGKRGGINSIVFDANTEYMAEYNL